MSDIKTIIDRNIPISLRGAVFTQADASAGDVILLQDTLGTMATRLKIETDNQIVVRFNVYHSVTSPRTIKNDFAASGLANISKSQRYKDTSQPTITITSTTPFLVVNYFSIQDIEIVSATGNFTITAQHVSDSGGGGGGSFNPSVDTFMDDDKKFGYGSDEDYWHIYNSTSTQYEFWSSNIDGGGTDGKVFWVEDGTDDVGFSGSIKLNNGEKLILDANANSNEYIMAASGKMYLYVNGTAAFQIDSSALLVSIAPTWDFRIGSNNDLTFGDSGNQYITYTNGTGIIFNDGTNDLITIPDDVGQIKITGQIYSILPTTLTPTGTTQTVDWNDGNGQVLDLESATGDVTLTLSNALAGASYVIKIIQDSTTPRNVVWPAAVKWPGGVSPAISTGANAVDLVSLFFDGTNYYGTAGQDFS